MTELHITSSKFLKDNCGFTHVFVDGCYLNQGAKAAGYGIFWGPNNTNNRFGMSEKEATNTTAEIQAAIVAIQQARELSISNLCVNTDAKIVVDAVEQLIPQWKQNNWQSLWDTGRIANRRSFEDLERAIRMSSHMNIKFKHIAAHSGNPYGNEADHLARKGAELHYN